MDQNRSVQISLEATGVEAFRFQLKRIEISDDKKSIAVTFSVSSPQGDVGTVTMIESLLVQNPRPKGEHDRIIQKAIGVAITDARGNLAQQLRAGAEELARTDLMLTVSTSPE